MMASFRSRFLLTSTCAGAGTAVLGSVLASALAARATPAKITPSGVAAVTLGKTYKQLRAMHLVGQIHAGCEAAGPNARAARLRAPLKGSVNFTQTTSRRVMDITVVAGATARGVGIGASAATIKRTFPKAIVDHSTDATFGVTIVKIPKSGGGRLQFAIDTKTKKATMIGIPNIPFCD